jgi:hypothetical protein
MPTCVDFTSYRLYERGAGPRGRIVGLISRAKGERMVRSKTAQAGLDWDGETLCFERIGTGAASAVPTFVPARPVLEPSELPIERSSTGFTQPEMNAIAGTNFRYGRSRTSGMTEEQRQSRLDRRGKRLPEEDLVETATNKLRAWQQLGPALQQLVREAAHV